MLDSIMNMIWGAGQPSYLSHGVRQSLDYLLVGCGYHTLSVDLDDTVADADTTSLCNAPSHEAADLWGQVKSAHTFPPHPEDVPPCPKDAGRGTTPAERNPTFHSLTHEQGHL